MDIFYFLCRHIRTVTVLAVIRQNKRVSREVFVEIHIRTVVIRQLREEIVSKRR